MTKQNRIVLPAIAVLFLVSCGQNQILQENQRNPERRLSVPEAVVQLAEQMDEGCADGWIAGREPRIFKSGYGKMVSAKKAKFAIAYAKFLADEKQDMTKSFSSYLPYSKRAVFAYNWWQSEPRFQNSTKHLQNYWIHESLLDAGELYWRASEALSKKDSAAVIAHDTEQNLVFRFMESENNQSTRDGFRQYLKAPNNEQI